MHPICSSLELSREEPRLSLDMTHGDFQGRSAKPLSHNATQSPLKRVFHFRHLEKMFMQLTMSLHVVFYFIFRSFHLWVFLKIVIRFESLLVDCSSGEDAHPKVPH